MATSNPQLDNSALGLSSFMQSPPGNDYQLLLNEFTNAGEMLSPDGLGRSPPVSGGRASDLYKSNEPHNGGFSNLQQTLLNQIDQDDLSWINQHVPGVSSGHDGIMQLDSPASTSARAQPITHTSPASTSQVASSSGSQSNTSVLQQAVAQMDNAAQEQLLSALLAQRIQNQSGSHQPTTSTSQTPTRTNSTNNHQPPSPLQTNIVNHLHQPTSQHPSPQSASISHPHPASFSHHSVPPSAVSSPIGSPFVHPAGNAQNYFAQQMAFQQGALSHQMLQQNQQLPQQSAYAPPVGFRDNTFAQQVHTQHGQGQGLNMSQDIQQQLQQQQQQQMMMDMLAHNAGGQGPDMNLRGADTGASYATEQTDDWVDDSYMFSPLLSPALTPHSTFTVASSLPTSGPSNSNLPLVSPAEFFSPLSSPALMPHLYNTDPAWQHQHHLHRNSLQGLVDQTQALGFDPTSMSPMMGPSPNGQGYPLQSPRMVASGSGDAGQSTAAGSGRRGAGSKKTRPSPLLKPAQDGPLRRKKTVSAGAAVGGVDNERRSSSVGSSGLRSVTTSPYVGPAGQHGAKDNGASHSGSANSSQPRTSPSEDKSGSNNSPSPVDLSTSMAPPTVNEIMGPPPPRSSSHSRTSSLHQQVMHQSLPPSGSGQPYQSADGVIDWMAQPVTPASFMSLPAMVGGVEQLSSLSPQLGAFKDPNGQAAELYHQMMQMDMLPEPLFEPPVAQPVQHSPAKSKAKSVKSSPALKAQSNDGRSTALPSQPIAAQETSAAPTSTKLAPKPKARTLASSAPASRPNAQPGPAAVRGTARIAPRPPTAKTGPSPKLGPTGATKVKPILPSSVLPGPAAHSAGKSGHQTGVEGPARQLGSDATTQNGAGAVVGGTDTRRTSHKAAEQKRRDSLKHCFEELRRILPPIDPVAFEEAERLPGDGKIGGQRGPCQDPDNPNRAFSKVALLRRSNEYVGILSERVDRRDLAIDLLRRKLAEVREAAGIALDEEDEELNEFDLDHLDKDEKQAGTLAFYENLDSDEEGEVEVAQKVGAAGGKNVGGGGVKGKGGAKAGSRRSSRGQEGEVEVEAMEVEGEE